jgi:hypothetical protein
LEHEVRRWKEETSIERELEEKRRKGRKWADDNMMEVKGEVLADDSSEDIENYDACS